VLRNVFTQRVRFKHASLYQETHKYVKEHEDIYVVVAENCMLVALIH